jgi:hypothetical protein
MVFEADFRFCLFLGRTEQSVQLTVGTENEVQGGRTTVRFWHGKRGRFCGTNLVL